MTCQRCKKPMPESRWKTCAPCRQERREWDAKRKAGQHTGRYCSYCEAPMGERSQVQCGAPDCQENYDADRAMMQVEQWRERYAINEDFRTRVLDGNRRWREENREAWLASNKRYYERTYRQRAAIFAAAATRRRALRRGATIVPFTREQLEARLSVYDACWICGTPEWTDVDHVKPLAKGGPHMLANLRPACRDCNRRKAAQWPFSPLSSLERVA